ncbi:hypothetical protein PR048_031038 [Dryococelus australis]|uniref:Uncharacterized protein n=1 Tax=Dryococelus australis TaxID=614101 RepID=A0ABQ9G889_9NEOP|nr:hypothetical protein PR048_031038 [Dryococelus australis]
MRKHGRCCRSTEYNTNPDITFLWVMLLVAAATVTQWRAMRNARFPGIFTHFPRENVGLEEANRTTSYPARVVDCEFDSSLVALDCGKCESHHRGSKLDPRSTLKTVAPFEFIAGLEIEIKSISNRRNWRFEISIRDQQPSLANGRVAYSPVSSPPNRKPSAACSNQSDIQIVASVEAAMVTSEQQCYRRRGITDAGAQDSSANIKARIHEVGKQLGDLQFPQLLHSGAAPYSHRFNLIGSQDLDVKNWKNISTPLPTATREQFSHQNANPRVTASAETTGVSAVRGFGAHTSRIFKPYPTRRSELACNPTPSQTNVKGCVYVMGEGRGRNDNLCAEVVKKEDEVERQQLRREWSRSTWNKCRKSSEIRRALCGRSFECITGWGGDRGGMQGVAIVGDEKAGGEERVDTHPPTTNPHSSADPSQHTRSALIFIPTTNHTWSERLLRFDISSDPAGCRFDFSRPAPWSPFLPVANLPTSSSGAVVTRVRFPVRPCRFLFPVVFRNHSRRMLRWVPIPSPIPLPCASCTVSDDLAVDETINPLTLLLHHRNERVEERENPEKTRRLEALSGTFPTCKKRRGRGRGQPNCRRSDNFLVTVAKKASCGLGIVRRRNPKLQEKRIGAFFKGYAKFLDIILNHKWFAKGCLRSGVIGMEEIPGDRPIERNLAVHCSQSERTPVLRATLNQSANRLLASHLSTRVRFQAGAPPNFGMWESCRTIPLVGGFTRISPIPPPPPLHSGAAPYLPHFTLIGSQEPDVKSRLNTSTPLHSTPTLIYARSKRAGLVWTLLIAAPGELYAGLIQMIPAEDAISPLYRGVGGLWCIVTQTPGKRTNVCWSGQIPSRQQREAARLQDKGAWGGLQGMVGNGTAVVTCEKIASHASWCRILQGECRWWFEDVERGVGTPMQILAVVLRAHTHAQRERGEEVSPEGYIDRPGRE